MALIGYSKLQVKVSMKIIWRRAKVQLTLYQNVRSVKKKKLLIIFEMLYIFKIHIYQCLLLPCIPFKTMCLSFILEKSESKIVDNFEHDLTLCSPWWCSAGGRWSGRCSLQTVCGLSTGSVCLSPGPQQQWPHPKPRSWFFLVRLWLGRRAGADPGYRDKGREGRGGTAG